MKKTIPALILGLMLGAAAAWLYTRTTAPAGGTTSVSSAPATAPAPAAPEKPNPLRLDAAARTKAGITLTKPVTATITPQVEGFARVLDTTPLVSMLSDIEIARIALDSSQKELDRTQKLFDAGGNASAQALQTAKAAVARDTAAINAAQLKLTATWGSAIAHDPAAAKEVFEHGAALFRIDLLPGDFPAHDTKKATLRAIGSSPTDLAAGTINLTQFTVEIIDQAPTADPQLQGLSRLAIVRDSFGMPPVGLLLRATLPAEGKPTTTLTIPRSAIIYHQGSAWIYILGEEDTFERKHVTLGRSLPDDRIAITTGLDDPDDQIVTTGAQQLLSAELQSGDTGGED